MAAAARSTGMAGKKPRRPYTITRPRERWTAGEHDRFLRAMVLFGRDWKRIEALVATKTSTQIRSHAQKHFIKAQKLDIVVPPPHPRRAAAVLAQPSVSSPACSAGGDAMTPSDETLIQLPLSPDDLYFAQVYRFIGDIFGSDAPRPIETQLQRLVQAPAIKGGEERNKETNRYTERKRTMMAAAPRSTGMVGKKPRKPYTVTRPRERWTADEHGRFLQALVLFGRDWKRIEAFVATKTSTQIRSHAQKHFLKAQKLGIAVPPPHPRRAVVLAQPPVSCPALYAVDAMAPSNDMLAQLPLSPDDLCFAQVYRRRGRARQRHKDRGTKKTMMTVAARSTGMTGKKPRRPYTITRPRERWTADEHERFLHARPGDVRLRLEEIEAFVATKTSTQIRSHAQKHFLRAQKLGIVAPPPHLRRAGTRHLPRMVCG
ncbi:hypothetical protein BAE44_0016911 [Dichanthelium oligosanthes]|uniref:Protein REVEILLE 8 n=1 Tax=Dichanthelium oligosanthes TaxID=888268 RepID=A0A1E5VA87_9POAL|nr:hypothetical protein BAE44_0016911 [Dichanthelium oligosanthes]